MSFAVGDTVGDYQVVSILGAGGMGKVYKVRNLISDRLEAMKVLLPNLEGEPELAERFLREIRVTASLDHPGIAGLHTAQRVGNQLLMVMEFVEGTTLEQLLRQGPLPLDRALDYASQGLAALGYAHARGVVHRDIKPANMMLAPDGSIKLMDFGIARMTADRRLTQTGRTLGSLYYMSPEQINGAVDLDARADLYSFGVSLYEMVTGQRPFQGDSDFQIMAAHLNSTPPPPIQIDPSLPPALNEIILTAIARDPAARFQSAEAMRNAIESVRQAPAAAAAPQMPPPAPAPAPSRRWLYMLAGSLATIAVLVAAATQIPKWVRARAGAQPPVVVDTQPSVKEEPPPPLLPPPVAPPEKTQPEPPEARIASPPKQITRPPERRPPETRPPAETAPRQKSQPAIETKPPADVPAPPEPPAAALRELRERLILLATRAGAVKSSLQRLEQQQARSGLGLRQDIAVSRQRMEYYLDEAEAALKAGKAAEAKQRLDAAEREVEKLEQFFGR